MAPPEADPEGTQQGDIPSRESSVEFYMGLSRSGINPDRAKIMSEAAKEDAAKPPVMQQHSVKVPTRITGANTAPLGKGITREGISLPPLDPKSLISSPAGTSNMRLGAKRTKEQIEGGQQKDTSKRFRPLSMRLHPMLDPAPDPNEHSQYLESLLRSRPLHLSFHATETKATGYIPPVVRRFVITDVGIAQTKIMGSLPGNRALPIPEPESCPSAADGGISMVVKGSLLEDIWASLSGKQKYDYCRQLREIVKCMRRSSDKEPAKPLGSVSSGGYSLILDKHVNSTFFAVRPHPTQRQFTAFLVSSFYPMVPEAVATALASQIWKNYRTVLTHGELCPKNIIVNQGKIVGIHGWDCSGMYPEWWEYVKFFEAQTQEVNEDWYDYASEIFVNEFSAELATYQGIVRCQRP